MRNIQDIFRTVISADFYGSKRLDIHTPRESYMCDALGLAFTAGFITHDEKELALYAIDEYIREIRLEYTREMMVALESVKYPGTCTPAVDLDQWADDYGKEFYWNWDGRPSR